MVMAREQHWNPSFFCPCSVLTATYEKFFQVDYTLHPFCSSDFVQEKWLNHIEAPDVGFYPYAYDFRLLAKPFFHSLASFCKVSIGYIENSLLSFNASLFIADKVPSSEIFIEETNEIIKTFISTTSRSFMNNLALISNTTRNNGLMSADLTNSMMFMSGTYPSFLMNVVIIPHYIPFGNLFSLCGCLAAVECMDPISIYSSNVSFTPNSRLINIPDLFLGCLMIEGIKSSSLSCMFNQSCVDLMSSWLNRSSTNAIDMNNLIEFKVNTTIEDIANEIFVDQWNSSASYRSFYESCRPDRCIYSLNEHNSFWLIVTTLFGLIGGLVKILQIVVPYLIKGIFALYSWYRRPVQREKVSFNFSFRAIIDRLRKFNLFPSNDPAADGENAVRDQLLSTRLFLIFLISSLILLITYCSQVEITKTITIVKPSIEQYTSLYNHHSLTLSCPCEDIAIPQQSFLSVHPSFHQVCESDFVDPQWSTEFGYSQIARRKYWWDFRAYGDAVFSTIASFCQQSQATIDTGLSVFGKSSFVTAQIVPQILLEEKGNLLIDLFKSTTENSFAISLQIVRDTTQANVFLSGYQTSMSMLIRQVTGTIFVPNAVSNVYNTSFSSCSCYFDPTCTEPAGLYSYPKNTLVYSIPGFFLGCHIVEATLKSNLAFLYNQTGINEFRKRTQFDSSASARVNTKALNSSIHSQYNITTPISILMQNLMIERWNEGVNYSAYYEHCNPIECKYTYTIKYHLVYIITTIIGLIGGLVTILQFSIPRAIKLIRWCYSKRCCRSRVQQIRAIQPLQTSTD